MRYKIQMQSSNGWADLKESEDDANYEVSLFDTQEEAELEVKEIIEALGDWADTYRVVPETVEQETEVYDR